VPDINLAAIYCFVQSEKQVVYDRILNYVKRKIPWAAPEKILFDFDTAAINAFRSPFPNSTLWGFYFHLTQSVMRKVGEIDNKGRLRK